MKKRGRKPEGRRAMTRTLTLSCGERLWRLVRAFAQDRKWSVSRAVRFLLGAAFYAR